MQIKIDRIGIDKISFYIPKFFFNTLNLQQQNISDVVKKTGQVSNALTDTKEDIITMGISAALNILQDYSEKEEIDYLIFATESSFDLAKSSSLFCKDILQLKNECNVFEIKQACYAGTAALIFAINYIKSNINKKILIITSDISKYEDHSTAQITQGAGACAFIVSQNPKIIEFDTNNFNSFSKNVFDFYKPIKSPYPIINGSLSVDVYSNFFFETFKKTIEKELKDYENNINNLILVPHLPFVNIFNFIELKISKIIKELKNQKNITTKINLIHQNEIKKYTSLIGNSYTSCLYINICSLLENCKEDLGEKKIYFFSFGSGANATLFTGKIVTNYQKYLKTEIHHNLFKRRDEISYNDFIKNTEKIFHYKKDNIQNRIIKEKDFNYLKLN